MKIAILDDYAGAALRLAEWDGLGEVTVFTDTVTGAALANRLRPFDVVCLMRERTPMDAALIAALPNLRLIVTTGPRPARSEGGAARAAGVQAIDSVYGQVEDLEGLRRWAAGSRRLGFQGMGCLHPRQIAVVHQAFDPSDAEIDRARRIVAAFEKAQAEGLGVVSLGSKMIDAPVVKQAQRLVDQARRSGRPVPADDAPGAEEPAG